MLSTEAVFIEEDDDDKSFRLSIQETLSLIRDTRARPLTEGLGKILVELGSAC